MNSHKPSRCAGLHAVVLAGAATLVCCGGEGVHEAVEGATSSVRSGPFAFTIGTTRVEAVFNDPIAKGPADRSHLVHIARLIDDTPDDGTIEVAIYNISSSTVFEAIERATERGVRVRVVHTTPESTGFTATSKALSDVLGADFRLCNHGSSTGAKGAGCISDDPSSLMHAKYALFSRTKDSAGTSRSNVVWFWSGNFTDGSGAKKFNDAITVYDDATLYENFQTGLWNYMWKQENFAGNDFYDPSRNRGKFGSKNSQMTVYCSPEQNTDLLLERLEKATPSPSCEIRVMYNRIRNGRSAVVDRLIELKRGGCKVRVAIDNAGRDGVSQIDDKQLEKLRSNGIAVRGNPIHAKLIVLEASYDGKPDRLHILTGSHNLTTSALEKNDELLVHLYDVPSEMYDAYVDFFEAAWKTGTKM